MQTERMNHSDRGQREFAMAAAALASYLQTERPSLGLPHYHSHEIGAGTSGYLGPRGLEAGFAQALLQSTDHVTRHVQARNTLERLVQWQDSQHQLVEQQRTQLHSRRESIWKRRCSELLGDQLADEACKSGLAAL